MISALPRSTTTNNLHHHKTQTSNITERKSQEKHSKNDKRGQASTYPTAQVKPYHTPIAPKQKGGSLSIATRQLTRANTAD